MVVIACLSLQTHMWTRLMAPPEHACTLWLTHMQRSALGISVNYTMITRASLSSSLFRLHLFPVPPRAKISSLHPRPIHPVPPNRTLTYKHTVIIGLTFTLHYIITLSICNAKIYCCGALGSIFFPAAWKSARTTAALSEQTKLYSLLNYYS